MRAWGQGYIKLDMTHVCSNMQGMNTAGDIATHAMYGMYITHVYLSHYDYSGLRVTEYLTEHFPTQSAYV